MHSPLPPHDAHAWRAVSNSAVHQLARSHYTAEQLKVWAPADDDVAQWAERSHINTPWVAEVDDCMAGFADLQPSCTIDQFFVSGPYAARGLGRTLMAQIHRAAAQAGMGWLWADVSLCAEPFFSAAALRSRHASRKTKVIAKGHPLSSSQCDQKSRHPQSHCAPPICCKTLATRLPAELLALHPGVLSSPTSHDLQQSQREQ